jgi:tRNA(adenine34) deaminase
MQAAMLQAQLAESKGEVPIGAIIVNENKLISVGYNSPISDHDATSHAEIKAIRAGSALLHNYRFPPNTILYTTLEPCLMCLGAIMQARISHVIYGAIDTKKVAALSSVQVFQQFYTNHKIQFISGVLGEECQMMLNRFFKSRRAKGSSLSDEPFALAKI